MSTSRRKSSGGRRRNPRSSRRQEGHHAAQAEAEETPVGKEVDHPLVPRNEPPMITTTEALDELVAHIREIGSYAYDTEFIGEETYHPRICLIQMATRERVALVDPLPVADGPGLDLTPVWNLIADPDVETIVHAGAQDLEPVVRFLDRSPANIFDTQIAAGFVGRPYPLGLRRLVQEVIGAHLGKALTFTQWDRRPLSAVHFRYAAADVRYLPAAREELRCELGERDHGPWAAEECAALSDVARYRFDPDARVARLIANRTPTARSVAILRELVILRDRIARAEDLPPRTILRDEVLNRLAKSPVKSVANLPAVKGLPRPLAERYGEELVEAMARALKDMPGRRGARLLPDESSDDTMRIDGLWSLASAYCLGRAISPALVGNRRRVAELYFHLKRDAAEDPPLLARGWRHELIGRLIEELLRGEREVRLAWEHGRLTARDRSPD